MGSRGKGICFGGRGGTFEWEWEFVDGAVGVVVVLSPATLSGFGIEFSKQFSSDDIISTFEV